MKRYRLAAGLTLDTLAERAALSARAISDLERGVSRAPRSETLTLLLEGLGPDLSPDDRAALTAAARPQLPPLDPVRPRHNLPIQLTTFLGRERELDVADALLRRPEARLLTVTGAGGTGKTRFAIQLAMGALERFQSGARLVTLAPVGTVELIGPAIARTLGASDADRRTATPALIELLGDQHLLLLLDNFEHLLPAAPILVDLLRACPQLKLLVTSRAALRVSGEQVFPISPLPLPDLVHLPPLAELARNPAVALFEDRARLARPDFALTHENADAVASICTRLDGLPLALELAAARIRLLPVRAMLTRLDEGPSGATLRLLTRGARDLPRRQQTLRDAIAWSYALLKPGDQRLFRAVGVFSGSCTLAAVEAVCRPIADAGLNFDAVDGLAELVDNSLVQQAAGPDGEPRFMMLDTLRAFALEQLSALGEDAQLRRRHAHYYLARLEATGALLFAGSSKRQQYSAEQDNVQAALRWLVKEG